MTQEVSRIRGVLRDVRRRWMWHSIFRCATRAAFSGSLVLLAARVAFLLVSPRTGVGLAAFAAVTVAGLVVAVVLGLWPLRRRPNDAQVARFIEERWPHLEDRLVTAVECASPAGVTRPSVLTDLLYRDAAARVAELDLDRTISRRALGRSGAAAALSALAFAGIGVVVAPLVRDGAAAMLGLLAPGRFGVHVSPGDVKLVAGSELRVHARLDFDTGGTPPSILLRDANGVVRKPMTPAKPAAGFEYVARPSADFRYVVTAGRAASSEYRVTVVHPPSVTAIDVHYQYPPAMKMPQRAEMNGGDVFGPAGTRVHLVVHTDRPAIGGSLKLSGGPPVPLAVQGDQTMGGDFTIATDGSYRVALKDGDGLESNSETQYFIRILADAPPDVRVVQPAADREATPLEEVTIAAHAEDDRGVKQFDLVYSVRGGPEVTVPFVTSGAGQSIDGKRVLYLEDLHVRPGDFITYYARARDAAPGGGNEARSDLLFLQVTPFEQEFILPQSQQASPHGTGASQNHSLDDLIKAQKEIIAATWKLDRRSRKSGAGSESDVKTVAMAQGALRTRAAAMTGSSFARASAGGQPPDAGLRTPDGDPMSNAIESMGRAEQSLNAIHTTEALPHETRALSELLKAKASNQRWQMMQAAGAGAGGDTGNADLTTMFDRELKREQRTNYEMPRGAQKSDEQKAGDALERVRQLAERQAELARHQQELARDRDKMSADEMKRQLERLTREQSDLRQQAEELGQRLQAEGGRREAGKVEGGKAAGAQAGRDAGSQGADRLRDASQAMGQAASNLRNGQLTEASARSGEAADRLRSAERQMQAASGGSALGDLQMQARQIADAQQRIARDAAAAGEGKVSETARAKPGDSKEASKTGDRPNAGTAGRADDAEMRRLAGEKERVADQVEQFGRALKGAAAGPGLEGRQQETLEGVSRDLDRLQLPKQMREQAAAMRSPEKVDVNRPPSATGEQDLAQTLARLADRLGGAAGSGDTQRTAAQLNNTKDARDRLAQLEQQIRELQRQGSGEATDARKADPAGRPGESKGNQPVGTSGRAAASNRDAELKRLQDEYGRELRRAADQLNRFGRDGSGTGFSAEGAQTLSPLSARGYNQDFSKWQQLSREITAGLERAETVLTRRLREQQARDRLQAPSMDRVPEQYRRLVEQYYQALAEKKK